MISTLAVALIAVVVAWSTDLFRMLGLVFFTQQLLCGILASSMDV